AGILDEVRIWSYARSASQIASNKNLQIRSETGLLGRWSLEETNGLLAQDSSGHGVQGTLINGPRWVADDRAPADVLTPIKLSVIDPERTELLRQSESKRVPPVFRHDPAIADQVEKGFRASLQTNKTFLAHPKSSQGIVSLREVMTRYLCPEVLPAEARLGPPNVRFYTRGFGSPSPDLELLESQSQSCSRTNLWPVGKARADLRRHFSTNDEALANYVATFVRENCIFDAELTRQGRLRQAESLFAADHYQPGQLIVQKGQIIDGRIRAALDELKAQIAADERNARAAVKQIRTEAELKDLQQRAALSEFKSKLFSEQNRWLLGGLIAV